MSRPYTALCVKPMLSWYLTSRSMEGQPAELIVDTMGEDLTYLYINTICR